MYIVMVVLVVLLAVLGITDTGRRRAASRGVLPQRSGRIHSSFSLVSWLFRSTNIQSVMQVIISFALLVSGLFVVLSQSYGTTEKHWAYGALGTVVGFWMRPTKR